MNRKIICVIANGYAEEMIAAQLMSSIRGELKKYQADEKYQLIGGSLVSSGKWYQAQRFATFFSGGVSPSGGFPTQSFSGFFQDLASGAFKVPFTMSRYIKEWSHYNLRMIIVVGDFLLLMTAVQAVNSKEIPIIFIPTAKSDYIQEHFKCEKKIIAKHACLTIPRDQLTTDNFNASGIKAKFFGNLIQDLIDLKSPTINTNIPIIALLPGSRNEAYGNFEKMLQVVNGVVHKIHWALLKADSVDIQKFVDILTSDGWESRDPNASVSEWYKDGKLIVIYSNAFFDGIALSCKFAVSLAGTAGEQIVGLGKPVVGFVGVGPQSTHRRMVDNHKLLGDSFIYEKDFPYGVISQIYGLLNRPSEVDRLGKLGIQRMGTHGAGIRVAQTLISQFLL